MSYSELKTPQATFRLIHRGREDKAFARDWPKNVDLIVPELVHDNPISSLEERFAEYAAELEANPSIKLLSEIAKKTKARIAFLDLAESPSLNGARDLGLGVFQGLAGLFFLFTGFKKDRKSKKRLFGLFGLVFLGLWLLISLVDLLGIILTRTAGNVAKKGPLKAIKEAVVLASLAHPEKTVVFWRNLVVAEKIWRTIDFLDEKNPMVAIDFHFGHAGLIKVLEWSSDFRLKLIDWLSPLVGDILRDPLKKDYLVRVILVKYNGHEWEMERAPVIDVLQEIT